MLYNKHFTLAHWRRQTSLSSFPFAQLEPHQKHNRHNSIERKQCGVFPTKSRRSALRCSRRITASTECAPKAHWQGCKTSVKVHCSHLSHMLQWQFRFNRVAEGRVLINRLKIFQSAHNFQIFQLVCLNYCRRTDL